jgi:hypothetical protein
MPKRLKYLRASGLPQSTKPRGRFALFFHYPSPTDWLPIDRAQAESWNIMLVWDTWQAEWRCDFIKRGQIVSARGETVSEAISEAWEQVIDLVEHARRPDSR